MLWTGDIPTLSSECSCSCCERGCMRRALISLRVSTSYTIYLIISGILFFSFSFLCVISPLLFFVSLELCRCSSDSRIRGGRDTTIPSPGRSPKQPLPGIGLHDPLHGRQACPEFNSLYQGVGQISPREGLLSCRPLP